MKFIFNIQPYIYFTLIALESLKPNISISQIHKQTQKPKQKHGKNMAQTLRMHLQEWKGGQRRKERKRKGLNGRGGREGNGGERKGQDRLEGREGGE